MHGVPAAGLVEFAVAGDHPPVDGPGGLDLDMGVGREKPAQTVCRLPPSSVKSPIMVGEVEKNRGRHTPLKETQISRSR